MQTCKIITYRQACSEGSTFSTSQSKRSYSLRSGRWLLSRLALLLLLATLDSRPTAALAGNFAETWADVPDRNSSLDLNARSHATNAYGNLQQDTHGVRKPLRTILNATHERNIVTVKFRDGLNVRLRANELVSTDPSLFSSARPLWNQLALGQWRRADVLPEDKIEELRQRAQANLGHPLPDLNLQFYLTLPPGLDAGAVIDSLNALEIVELAQPVPRPVPPPTPPDFGHIQINLFPPRLGMDVWGAWTNYNDVGQGIQVADCEYSFNPLHQDLPSVANLDTSARDPFNDQNHGTATFGVLGSLRNGWGTTGISPNARFYFSGTYFSTGWLIDRAITTALNVLGPGDVLVIEQQTAGPNHNNVGQFGLVPVDWYKPFYDRIVMAVGLGIVVVEAAGNGSQNLDDPIYSTENGGHWPFLAANSSGAIIVGAGASANGSSTESSRLSFSNYGSRVDLQGWGENVPSTGYGDLYNAEGANLLYTRFSGTSSATPMVAGACILLQSAYKAATGSVLPPSRIRRILLTTGSPQQNGTYPASQNIGPLPNIVAAIAAALGGAADSPIACTGFNRDVVVERSATGGDTTPYGQTWASWSEPLGFYEAGLGGIGSWANGSGLKGLPQGGAFISQLDGKTVFQFAPYNGSNVLYLTQSSPSGTLTLTTPRPWRSLSILAASDLGGTNGSFVIHFANGATSLPISFNANDWWTSYSAQAALTNCGSIVLGNWGAFFTYDPDAYPNLYQTTVDLAARGWQTNPIVSLTFTRPSGPGTSTSTTTGIFALSGTPQIQLSLVCHRQAPSWLALSWNAIAGSYYQLQYKTNVSQASWLNLGSPVQATTSTLTLSNSIGTDARRFYRVSQLP